MVQKVKKGIFLFAEWCKNAQTLLWAVSLVFFAGVAWSQVATKNELEAKCKEIKSDFSAALDKRNKEVIDRLQPISEDMAYSRKRTDGMASKIDKIDGRTEVLMKAIRK